jgi:hypothetical protein
MKGDSDTSVTLEVGMTATMDARLPELRSASGTKFAASDERNKLETSSAMEHTQAATVPNGLEGLRVGSDKVEAEWPRFGGWQ